MSPEGLSVKEVKRFIPEGNLRKQIPYWVHLSILCFIQSVPQRVLEKPISAAETKMPKCLVVWMDGWMGGDILPPSIFLFFNV